MLFLGWSEPFWAYHQMEARGWTQQGYPSRAIAAIIATLLGDVPVSNPPERRLPTEMPASLLH